MSCFLTVSCSCQSVQSLSNAEPHDSLQFQPILHTRHWGTQVGHNRPVDSVGSFCHPQKRSETGLDCSLLVSVASTWVAVIVSIGFMITSFPSDPHHPCFPMVLVLPPGAQQRSANPSHLICTSCVLRRHDDTDKNPLDDIVPSP